MIEQFVTLFDDRNLLGCNVDVEGMILYHGRWLHYNFGILGTDQFPVSNAICEKLKNMDRYIFWSIHFLLLQHKFSEH